MQQQAGKAQAAQAGGLAALQQKVKEAKQQNISDPVPNHLVERSIQKLGPAPSLTNAQAKEVVETWDIVRVNLGHKATDLFYQEFFKAKPNFRETIFKNVNIEKQSKLLFSMLDQAIAWLDNPDELVPALLACGQRHVHYGVETFHYPIVGNCLIRTLRAGLGERFTP